MSSAITETIYKKKTEQPSIQTTSSRQSLIKGSILAIAKIPLKQLTTKQMRLIRKQHY
jgi:hypothetical protein